MVFTCGILDGLAYTFTGLGRMTLEPEKISCQGYTNQRCDDRGRGEPRLLLESTTGTGTKPQAPHRFTDARLQTEVPDPE